MPSYLIRIKNGSNMNASYLRRVINDYLGRRKGVALNPLSSDFQTWKLDTFRRVEHINCLKEAQEIEALYVNTDSIVTHSPPPKLTLLPPEIRKRIYHFARVESSRIIIPPQGPLPAQSALLRTCKKIRKEARLIYYREIAFKCVIDVFDASQLLKLCRLTTKSNWSTALKPSRNWKNLKTWLAAIYRDERYMPGRFEPAFHQKLTVFQHTSRMIGIAKQDGMSWSQVEDLLEVVQGCLVAEHHAWS